MCLAAFCGPHALVLDSEICLCMKQELICLDYVVSVGIWRLQYLLNLFGLTRRGLSSEAIGL